MKSILMGLIFLFGISLHSFAQTVDEIINKYVEANGGIENLNQLKTVVKVGVLEKENQEFPINWYVNNLTGYKLEIEIEGVKNFELVNKNEGYTYFPFMGQEELLPMTDDMFSQSSFNLNLLPAFINYAENNYTVELKGIMEQEASIAYKLEVTSQNGQKVDYFIDKKSGYLIKTIFYNDQKSETKLKEIKYSDFRLINDKYIFPFNLADDLGTIQFTSIEANVPIKEAVFKP